MEEQVCVARKAEVGVGQFLKVDGTIRSTRVGLCSVGLDRMGQGRAGQG